MLSYYFCSFNSGLLLVHGMRTIKEADYNITIYEYTLDTYVTNILGLIILNYSS